MLQYTAHTTVYRGTLLTVLHTHCKKRQQLAQIDKGNRQKKLVLDLVGVIKGYAQ